MASVFSFQGQRSTHRVCTTVALIGCAIWLNVHFRIVEGRVAHAQVESGPTSQPAADERAAAETKRALARYAQSRLPAAGAYRGAALRIQWHRIQNDLIAFSTKEGKPLIFLEVGWFSQANAANEPWDYTKDQALALELQRKLYEGFFRSWYGNPNLGGFMIWEWALGDVPADDKGFSPQNKPANKVLSEWLAKRPWVAK